MSDVGFQKTVLQVHDGTGNEIRRRVVMYGAGSFELMIRAGGGS